MSERTPIRTDGAPAPGGPYSQAIKSGGFLFLAGQGPFRPDGSKVEGPFEDQARQTFQNLQAVAAAAGASLADAVRVGVYLRDMSNFPVLNKVYTEFFRDPMPARTTIQSDLPGFEIEIDAIVAVSPSPPKGSNQKAKRAIARRPGRALRAGSG